MFLKGLFSFCNDRFRIFINIVGINIAKSKRTVDVFQIDKTKKD